MAREGSLGKLLKELALAPWWVGVTVSAVVYVGLSMMLPMFADGPITKLVSGIGAPLAVLLLIPAAVSALRDWKGRRMLVANRRKESFRALGWQQFEELIEAHYRSGGYQIRRETRGGPDGGVDVRLQAMDGRTYLVQCQTVARAKGGREGRAGAFRSGVRGGGGRGNRGDDRLVHAGGGAFRGGDRNRSGRW